MRRFRWTISTVAAVVGCYWVTAAGAQASAPLIRPGKTYTPVFRAVAQPPAGGEFEFAGDYTLQTDWQPGTALPGAPLGTVALTNSLTGRSYTTMVPQTCGVTLGPTRLFEDCPTGPGTSVLTAQTLPTGQPITLGTNISLGAIGRDWAQEADNGPFINLTTGKTIRNILRTTTSRRLYATLDSPRLFHTACTPIKVPDFPASAGTITFFPGQRSVIRNDGGLRVQRCGSSDTRTIRTNGGASTNGHIYVWPHATGGDEEIQGFDPRSGRRFVIALPRTSQFAAPIAVNINNDEVIVGNQVPDTGGLETEYSYSAAPLPQALR